MKLKQTKETAERTKNIILKGMTKTFIIFEMIDEKDSKNLEEELFNNKFLLEEIIDLSKTIAPYIPYIGLTCAGFSIGKYMYNKYNQDSKKNEENKEQGKKEHN